MTSDETIQQAARVLGPLLSGWDLDGRPDVDGGIDVLLARALYVSGLLAPAPLRQEWGIEWPDGELWHYPDRASADAGAGDGTHDTDGTPVHRWVTDWETP